MHRQVAMLLQRFAAADVLVAAQQAQLALADAEANSHANLFKSEPQWGTGSEWPIMRHLSEQLHGCQHATQLLAQTVLYATHLLRTWVRVFQPVLCAGLSISRLHACDLANLRMQVTAGAAVARGVHPPGLCTQEGPANESRVQVLPKSEARLTARTCALSCVCTS